MINSVKKILAYVAAIAIGPAVLGLTVLSSNQYADTWTATYLQAVADQQEVPNHTRTADGTSIHHFGTGGNYEIECKGGAIVSSQLPKGADLPEDSALAICGKIS